MSEIGPVKAAERLDALDVLRGFALCGILLMNIPVMGQSWLASAPLGKPSLADPSWVTWIFQKLFFEGSMRGLFTLLFGAGILFMTRRAAVPGGPVEVADVFYRRCLGLMVLGLANVMVFVWPGDIVYIYGVSGLFLFIFRRCKPSTLLILAILMVLVETAAFTCMMGPRLGVLYKAEQVDAALAKPAHPPITKAQQDMLNARTEQVKKAEPDAKALAEETKARQSGWPGVVGWSFAAWSEWALGIFGLVGAIMESIAFMLLGMALFKWRVLMGERSMALYAGLAAGGLVVAMGLRGYSAWLTWTHHASPTFATALYQSVVYEFGRLPLTLFWLGAVIMAWKALPKVVFAPLRALGKMALTNYLGQSLITSVFFYGFHFYGKLNWAQLWEVAAAVWIGEAIFSLIWLRFFDMGPAEWALRSVTYRRWQPFARARGRE